MSKISTHITLREGIESYTAKRKGIENIRAYKYGWSC